MYALLATILISIVISPISPMETVAHRDGCQRWHSCPSDDGSYVSATANEDEDDKENSSGSGYESFQDCLAEVGQSPTEQQVQDCIDSSYGGQDDSENGPSESADENDEHRTDVIQKYDQE